VLTFAHCDKLVEAVAINVGVVHVREEATNQKLLQELARPGSVYYFYKS